MRIRIRSSHVCSKRIAVLISVVLLWLSFIAYTRVLITRAEESSNPEVGFNPNDVFIYKNEHYDLDEYGHRTENITKWNRIVIEGINRSADGSILNVTWTLYEAVNTELFYLDHDPSLWNLTGIVNYTSTLNRSDPISYYQVLFNERDAKMSDVTPDLLLKQYVLFYTNELGYFESRVERYSKGNTVVIKEITPSIKYAYSRTLEAYIDARAAILLNGSCKDIPDAWYNITLHLKLYLVYGLTSNIALSYNINYTIHEVLYKEEMGHHTNNTIRQIIFWNIRRPTSLTEDYPFWEVLGFGTTLVINGPDVLAVGLVVAGAVSIPIIKSVRSVRRGVGAGVRGVAGSVGISSEPGKYRKR